MENKTNELVLVVQQLAECHHRVREFLAVSEEFAHTYNLTPRQLRFMLALRGLPEGDRPTITTLASRLCLKHHSVVESIDRLVERGLVLRCRNRDDRREVFIEVSPCGEELFSEFIADFLAGHRQSIRSLAQSLNAFNDEQGGRAAELTTLDVKGVSPKSACQATS